jgi:hypothetical protein
MTQTNLTKVGREMGTEQPSFWSILAAAKLTHPFSQTQDGFQVRAVAKDEWR